jgi:hypothetical protein
MGNENDYQPTIFTSYLARADMQLTHCQNCARNRSLRVLGTLNRCPSTLSGLAIVQDSGSLFTYHVAARVIQKIV